MTNYSKKLIQGTLTVLFFSVFSIFLGYGVKYLLAQTIDVKDIGLFFSVLGFVSFFAFFRDLGLSDALIYFIPRFLIEKSKKKVKESILFTLFVQISIGLLFFVLMLFFSKYLARDYFKDIRASGLLFFLSLYFIIDGIHEVLLRIYQGYQKIFFQQGLDFCFQLFSALFIIFVIFFKKNIILFGLAYFLADFITVIIFYFVFIKKIFTDFNRINVKNSKKLKKQLLEYSLPLMTWTLAETGYAQQTIILLTLFSGLESVGYYIMIKAIAKLSIFLYKACARVFSPIISELWKKNKISELNFLFKKQLIFIYMTAFPVIFGIVFFSDIALRVLYGEQYVVASFALKIAALYFLFDIVNSNLNFMLQNTGNSKIPRNNAYIKFFVNLIFNLIFIPRFGLVGAVIADLIAIFAAVLYALYFNIKKLKLSFPVAELLKLLCSSCFYIFSIIALRLLFVKINLNVYLEIFFILSVSGIIYLFFIFVFKLMDLKKLNDIIKKSTNNKISFFK